MSARPRAVAALAALAALSLGACSLGGPRPPRPVPAVAAAEAEWPNVRRDAFNAAIVRDFGRADSLLRTFAARFPGTQPAAETVFYRALFRMDPGAEGTPPDSQGVAKQGLKAYLEGGSAQPHYVESVVLLRLIGHLDSLHATAAELVRQYTGGTTTGAGAAAPVARDSSRAREEEIARLRTELEQTRAELDRIRRRLAPPRPD